MSRTFIPPENLEEIKRRYPNENTKNLAKEFNIGKSVIYRVAQKFHLKKTDEFNNSPESGRMLPGSDRGKNFRYPKGHIPQNKGKKMPAEVYAVAQKTMFKKGQKPKNTKNTGDISTRIDKRGAPYMHIKIADKNWEYYHRHVWEKVHGKIPKGMQIHFKDGNTLNCDINNLEMLHQAECMKKNTLSQWPQEVKEVIKLKNKLVKKIRNGKE